MLLIAAAVLVPFGVLVAWGLSALQEAPVVVPPVEVAPSPVAAPIAEVAPSRIVEPPPVAVPAPAQPLTPALSPSGEREATVRAAVIEQLTPVVNLCFMEMSGQLKQAIRISATFEADPTGALQDVRVKMKSADPYVVACVQDALEGAILDKARGLPQGPIRHTFTFKPDGAK